MALEYFPCYYSYRKKLAKLSDQEVGRLFRALLEYGEVGETKELTGRESVAFDFIADDIDRAKNAYEEKCVQNRLNRQGAMSVNDRQRASTNVPKTKDKDKSKTETKDKTNLSPDGESIGVALARSFQTEELQSAFSDWLGYMSESGKPCGPTRLRSLVIEVKNNAGLYGEAAVASLIRQCMAAGWQSIVFERLEKVGGKERPEGVAPATGESRGAKNDMERMRRMLEQMKEV